MFFKSGHDLDKGFIEGRISKEHAFTYYAKK